MIVMRKTKIIATIGPSSFDPKIIRRMIKEGVDGFRINFAHGTAKEWLEAVKIIRECEEETREHVALIGDLQGPNVRVGDAKQQYLERGMEVQLLLAKSSEDKGVIPIPCREFFEVLDEGDRVVFADGEVVVEVKEVHPSGALGVVVTEGSIGPRKSVNIEGKRVPLPPLTAKDREDVVFAVKNGFSHIMVSFVESKEHVRLVRRFLDRVGGSDIWVLSKIETRRGVENLESIVSESDGIVVARGDLGKHFPLETLPGLQSVIINKARSNGRMVVLATQLLSSMVNNPTPTRSEVVDVYNAVVEGSDALMLTNETAVGKYPVAAICWLKRIILEAERHGRSDVVKPQLRDLSFRFACGVVELASSLEAMLLVYSMTGRTAERISLYRPLRSFFVGVPNANVARRVRLLWGAHPIVADAKGYIEGLDKTRKMLVEQGMLGYGDTLVETYRIGVEGSSMIRITQVQ